MKKGFQFLLFCSVIFIALQACNKPVYKYNPDFEGTWRTIPVYDSLLSYITTSEIVIAGGDGTFKNSCKPCGPDLCECVSSQVGKAVMNSTENQMKIGSHGYALVINEEPNIDVNGLWTMKIAGLRYFKQ